MKTLLFIVFIFLSSAVHSQMPTIKIPPLPNGAVWKDTDGKVINAHGGGLLFYDGIYYWYGEVKKGKTWLVPDQSWEDYRVPAGGVTCYSSKDMQNWKMEGIVLAPVTGDPAHDLDTSRVIERPKVIYNKLTGQFVMWMHVDKNDYSYSQAGVAISDKPTGPFRYVGSVKPNGQMSRDLTLYKDDDARAYLIYASESNKTMQVCLLSDDYLSPTPNYTRITTANNREAPAVFKYKKKYYLITSDCTGWSPNPATYAVADSLLGRWEHFGNPCTGPGADSTFGAQSTFVMPIIGTSNEFLFMADRWNKTDLPDSRYVWLTVNMHEDKPVIPWVSSYRLASDRPPVNILPLGNSITNGTSSFNSYRRPLWNLLHKAGYNFDFIGSWNKLHMGAEVPHADFDMDHEGHSGWTAANVLVPPDWDKQRGNIDDWLKLYRPDIVLMEFGTNEVFQCASPKKSIGDIAKVIDKLRSKNPQVVILLAQIPPLGKKWAGKKLCGGNKDYASAVRAVNAALSAFAKMKSNGKSPIKIVDQYSGIDPAKTMYDDIHPNEKGEEIMAERWFAALKPYMTGK